jgi:hypothetical protein
LRSVFIGDIYIEVKEDALVLCMIEKQTWSYGGTKLATFLTTKASPGWKSST